MTDNIRKIVVNKLNTNISNKTKEFKMSQKTNYRIGETTDAEGRAIYYIQGFRLGMWEEDNNPAQYWTSKKEAKQAIKELSK